MEAKRESRNTNDTTEWSLSSIVYNTILQIWGPFQIDLFASRLNYKVPTYASWTPDPGAMFTGAFSFHCGPYYFYAFPPFSLIALCLQKVEEDLSSGVILVPLWPYATMVSSALSCLGGSSSDSAQLQHSANSASQQELPSTGKEAKTVGMCCLRESILERSNSDAATSIIMQSCSDSTHKQYQPHITKCKLKAVTNS